MNKKLISIVTVIFNDYESITETLESIFSHKSAEIEYIIIDGGSTDGTLEIIKENIQHIDILITEPDKGIYDAMNKAIAIANGNYILNINSGDTLLINPINYIEKDILNFKAIDLILFNVMQSNGQVFKNKLSSEIKIHNTIHHQGVLYKTDKEKLYDLNYLVFSDFDYNQKAYKSQIKFLKIEKTLSRHDIGGLSHLRKHFGENAIIISKNFGKFYVLLSFIYFKIRGLSARFKNI